MLVRSQRLGGGQGRERVTQTHLVHSMAIGRFASTRRARHDLAKGRGMLFRHHLILQCHGGYRRASRSCSGRVWKVMYKADGSRIASVALLGRRISTELVGARRRGREGGWGCDRAGSTDWSLVIRLEWELHAECLW
jgi:hypothetical protein